MCRYEDVGYYHWLLARTHLSEAQRQREEGHGDQEGEGHLVSRFHWHIEQAELYHVYHYIHRYLVRGREKWREREGVRERESECLSKRERCLLYSSLSLRINPSHLN